MKKTIATVALAAVAVGASAQDLSKLSASTTLSFESEYIFRGVKLGGNSVQPGLEAKLPVFEGEVYGGFWGSYDVSGQNSRPAGGGALANEPTENDFYIGYTQALTEVLNVPVSIDVGYTYYGFPGAGINREHEIYLGFTADYTLSPSLYTYYNFTKEQWVFEGAIGHSFDLSQHMANLSLDLGGYLGLLTADDSNGDQQARVNSGPFTFQNRNNNGDNDGYTYWGATADLVYTLNEVASVSVGVRYAGNNNNNSNRHRSALNPEVTDSFFWWGTSASFGF